MSETTTGIDAGGSIGTGRRVHIDDPGAPVAAVVVPSVFVAVRDDRCRLLLVRRRDSGRWELPGGRVDVGESAVDAALRETAEESGLRVCITGVAGLFTDPRHIVEAPGGGEIRQQFVVCFHAWAVGGSPRPDMSETVEVAWYAPEDVPLLSLEPGARHLIRHALSGATEPHLD